MVPNSPLKRAVIFGQIHPVGGGNSFVIRCTCDLVSRRLTPAIGTLPSSEACVLALVLARVGALFGGAAAWTTPSVALWCRVAKRWVVSAALHVAQRQSRFFLARARFLPFLLLRWVASSCTYLSSMRGLWHSWWYRHSHGPAHCNIAPV